MAEHETAKERHERWKKVAENEAEAARARFAVLNAIFDNDFVPAFTIQSTEAAEAAEATQRAFEARETEVSPDGFVEYRPGSGDWPVVVCCPHGGDERPDSVPDRSSGDRARDAGASDVADAVFAGFSNYSRGRAALVTMRLARSKCDVDGDRASCCEGEDAGALAAYDWYHGKIAEALAEAVRIHDHCLLFEVRCQDRAPGVVEFGYMVAKGDLETLDADGLDALAPTSLDALTRCDVEPSRAAMIRGRHSLSTLLNVKGFAATPDHLADEPVPATTQAFGHALAHYGAPATLGVPENDWNRKVAAVQIDAPRDGFATDDEKIFIIEDPRVLTDEEKRAKFGDELCDATRCFLWTYAAWIYKMPFEQPTDEAIMLADGVHGGVHPFKKHDTSRYFGGISHVHDY